MRIEIDPVHPEPRKIARAASAIAAGGVIAYPTDTVYGLGCDLGNKRAIDLLYEVKRMDRTQPLAFLVPDLSHIARYAVVQDFHYRFIKHLIPGPYTFVLQATRDVPKLVMTKRKTIGIRVPDHAVTQALLLACDGAIMNTSAVHSSEGADAIVDPETIDERFPRLELILDAGIGEPVASTVIDLTGEEPALIREGAGMDRIAHLFGERTSLPPDWPMD